MIKSLALVPSFLALAAFLVGCGDEDPAPGSSAAVDFQDGSRLKLPHWSTADGLSRWQGTIYDSGRREPCAFARAADGKRRCMPDTSIYEEDVFGDAACTEPLAVGSGGTPDPYARFLLPATACEGGSRIELREVGAELGEDQAYALSDAGCVPTLTSKKLVHYRTGRILPPESFVSAEEVVVPAPGGGGRLAEVHLRAEDGAWIRQGLYDVGAGVPCTPQPTSDGELRCLPAGRYALGPVGDLGQPDCTGPRIATEASCTEAKADLIADVAAVCPRQVRLYAPGPAWTGGQTFGLGAEGQCLAGPLVTAPSVELAAEIAPARFARIETRQVGSGRLRVTRYADADGQASIPVAVYDSLLEKPCGFGTAPDGQTRCVPLLLLTVFRDAACADPVGLDISGGTCQSEPAAAYVAAGGRLHARGDRLPAPPSELFSASQDMAACTPAAFLVSETFAYYAVGPEIPTELVPAMTVK